MSFILDGTEFPKTVTLIVEFNITTTLQEYVIILSKYNMPHFVRPPNNGLEARKRLYTFFQLLEINFNLE